MIYVIAGNPTQFAGWWRSIRLRPLIHIRNLTLPEQVRSLSGELILLVGTYWENREVLKEAAIREQMGRLHFVTSFIEPKEWEKALIEKMEEEDRHG